MKLCPQCAFIYEDHQRICDMDGAELVHDADSAVRQSSPSPASRFTVDLTTPTKSLPTKAPSTRAVSRRLPVLVLLLIVLVTLLSVLVFSQVRRSRTSRAVQSQSPARLAESNDKSESAVADLVASTSKPEAIPAEQVPESEEPPADSVVTPAINRVRLASSPVAAGVPGTNSHAVILRLTNGAAINADEAWERKEGIWYRQAGMVTFLPRNRVRTIERVSAPRTQPRTATVNSDEGNSKSNERAGQDQLRIRRLEAAEVKKPSRVKSFLKLTGRVLKKPFKF